MDRQGLLGQGIFRFLSNEGRDLRGDEDQGLGEHGIRLGRGLAVRS